MPTTLSAGVRPSSRSGRKTSVKSVSDEPSTSADQTMEEIGEIDSQTITSKRDEVRAILIGRLFAIMREQRDKTERYLAPPEKVNEEVENEEKEERLAPLNEHILQLEQSSCGTTLEEMLKDPKYANYSDMQPSIEEELNNGYSNGPTTSRTLEPIEVKIEDNDDITTAASTILASGNQESNVERAAKRENHVMMRIAELRRTGLWSNSRLPKCVEPRRNKTHWDYLLEEVVWMAGDFHMEAKKKKIWAKKLVLATAKVQHDKEAEIEKAEERALRDKKKLCANVAKMIRDFWQGVDKVVDIRSKEIMDARVRKARNEHLMFVIGQVNEMSNIVQEGLVSSKSPSIASRDDDKEFSGEEYESDDERTIATAEKSLKGEEVKNELEALNTESTADFDDVLASLPLEYLVAYGMTPEEVEKLKKTRKDEKENERMEIDTKTDDVIEQPSTSSDSSSKARNDSEKSQDQTAEDGNGDGRGVLENVDYVKLNSENSDERQKELANIAEEALKFQPKGYTLETTQVKTPVPFLIRGTLREYQMVGLDWMVTLYEKNLNGILADEMGLGKTIQTISLLAHLACSESIWGPHLVVVPTSVILNWEMEFKKWCPALKILTYFGSAKDRAEKRKGWTKPNTFHVCITSYKTVTQDIRSFKQRAWQYLILDEAQNIKNWKSQRWQALLNVRARRRLLLTGTPLQNSLMELWSLMHFLMPTIFSSHDDFKDWFSNPLTGMMEGNVEFNAPLVQRLHKVLRPFILRRLKKEVEKQLPEKTEHVVKCSLSKRQRYLYDDFMSRRSTKDNLKSGNMMSVLNIVMQLRKCCNHPNLFEPRPVVAPFVIKKQQLDLPAHLFEIAEQEPEIVRVPEIFNLSDRIGAWQTGVSSRKPLVEEIECMNSVVDETNLIPPIVEGFRFNRNAFVNKPTRDLATLALSDPNGSEEEVKTNGTSAPPANLSNSSNPSNSSGAMTSAPGNGPFIRSRTVLNTAPLTVTTERSGFNYSMANSGQRTYLDQKAQYSPPLKKPKMTGAAINFADYVPSHVLEKMEHAHRSQLEVVRRRFGKIRTPIIANEVLNLLIREISEKRPKMSRIGDLKVRETLGDYVDILAERFGMYIDPVLTDAWQCRPSSSGLPSYVRNNLTAIENDSRMFLLKSSSSLDQKFSISRTLQFPELRLIEYDCGKLQTLAILLRQLYVHKHRCLIFTQMSKMLDVLQTFLSHHGYQYFRLDGTTGIEQRQAMVERFNADSKVFCFILSTRSGGVGVNLTGADTVIFYDSDWNPTMDAQAQDRCHRIGQTRNVSIYRLISERTIEENILKKATQKRKLGELAIDDAGFTPDFFKQSDSIRDLFDGEDVDVSAPTDVPVNEKDLENVMAKCEDEADVHAAKLAQAEAKVDSAEFDENAKVPTANTGDEDADEKFVELINQLKPIERYAINFLEEEYKPDFEEEIKEAEAMIDQKREEWDQKMTESAKEAKNENDVLNEFDDDPLFDNDFYLGGNLMEEVRNRRRNSQKSKPNNLNVKPKSVRVAYTFSPSSSSIVNSRIRSPSKRKSIAPSLTPYVSSAHHALASPPISPVKPAIKKKSIVMKETIKKKKTTTIQTKTGKTVEKKVKFENKVEEVEVTDLTTKKVTITEKPKEINKNVPSTSTPSASSEKRILPTTSAKNNVKMAPVFNRSQTLLPVKVFVSPSKLTPGIRKVSLVATRPTTTPTTSTTHPIRLIGTPGAATLSTQRSPAVVQRRLVVMPGTMQRVRPSQPGTSSSGSGHNPVVVMTRAQQPQYVFPGQLYPRTPGQVVTTRVQGSHPMMGVQSVDRPNFGIYERPRLSLRARSDSDPSRQQPLPQQQHQQKPIQK